MADIVIPNEGKTFLLDYITQKVVNNYTDWQLMLWTNASLSPSGTTVYANLTEATFPGYARVVLTHSLWGAATIVSNQAVSVWGGTQPIWTNGGSAQPIFGYAYVTTSSPKIMLIQKYDTPVPMDPGGILTMVPQINLSNL